MIRTTFDIVDVLSSEADMFFFDIEETILSPNMYYKLIFNKEYGDLLSEKICHASGTYIYEKYGKSLFESIMTRVMYLGKNFQRDLMQSEVVDVIRKLKSKGKAVFALTSGYPSQEKRNRMTEHGIYMDGYLFSRGRDKGPYLVNFLRSKDLKGNCCFVDNHMSKIVNVEESFNYNFPERSIDLVHYCLVDKMKGSLSSSITRDKFINYWVRVANAVENGGVDSVRNEIRKRNKFNMHKRNKNNPRKANDKHEDV